MYWSSFMSNRPTLKGLSVQKLWSSFKQSCFENIICFKLSEGPGVHKIQNSFKCSCKILKMSRSSTSRKCFFLVSCRKIYVNFTDFFLENPRTKILCKNLAAQHISIIYANLDFFFFYFRLLNCILRTRSGSFHKMGCVN